VAIALSMLGLFGVLTRAVEARTREIGIRMVCGATPAAVRRQVLGRSAMLTLAGLALGALAGLPATDLLQGQLFAVAAHDPAAWALAAATLLALALTVSLLPANRATAVDPVQAMRHE
jgi:ABC-type antimicrobial peptide transport system permease subunit